MGLTASLYTAGQSLELFSAGIQVAGQNIANANSPNYVRERLLVSTSSPYQSGGLLFGTGAQADGIRQQLDKNLESQIYLANADVSSANARVNGYTQLQLIIGELGESDLSTRLNDFLGAMNDLVNQPELTANRQQVVQQGELLANTITSMRDQLDRARTSINSSLNELVVEANELIQQIADLNPQIVRMESAGLLNSDAGGLRTERLTALNRLAEIMPIRIVEQENGIVDVFSGNDYLVIQGSTNELELVREEDRGIAVDQVRFSKTQHALSAESGELMGAVEARDSILGGFVDQLDQYARALVFDMNTIHSSGEGTVGYQSVTSLYEINDPTAALNQAGLTYTPQHGSFDVKVYDKTTDTYKTTTIDIDLDGLGGNDTTLEDLRAALAAVGNLDASIDTTGRLTISAAAGYDVRFSNDSSNTLAALGINTFFNGKDANEISVNSALVDNPNLLAVGTGGGAGDNSNAVRLATFMEQPLDSLGGFSLDEFYERVVTQVAEGASAESAIADGFSSFQASLLGQRQQISGVSLDEEAIRILEMQHGYTASARIISTLEELFNTLVSL